VFISLQTGNALSFFLHNIASNPDKQEKLYAEIQQVLPDTSTTVLTGETMQKMVYLKAR